MLRFPKSLDSMSRKELYKKFERPALKTVVRVDKQPLSKGAPKHAIAPMRLAQKNELVPLSDAEIFLTDFGESFLPSTTQ
jgi:serine/threonine-protein kinase SRPK3